MANTLKFGNGQWYGKAGSILAYNDENNNYKPLPFTFTRASSATRVNESGLIESVGSGVPRVDYLNNANGHLLLEPARTNLALYGTQISSYNGARLIKTDNQSVSPDGSVNAASIVPSSTSGTHYFYSDASITSGQTTTISFFVKENGYSKLKFLFEATNGVYAGQEVWFDIAEGTVGTKAASITASVENYGNGWYRCIASTAAVGTGTGRHYFGFGNNTETSSFAGDDTSGFYGYGVQIEAGSYATSYIPTSGSSVTRVADAATQLPPSGVLNNAKGTIFLSFRRPTGSLDFSAFGVSDGTTNNEAFFRLTTEDTVEYYVRSGNVQYTSIIASADLNVPVKIAVVYDTNYAAMYINGVLVGPDLSVTVPATINRIHFTRGNGTLNFVGEVFAAQYYNEVLSASQLIALTS